MRQYADAKAERELLDKLRERAANYFLEYAKNFCENFDMLEMEKENILSGMNWAVARRDLATGEEKKNASRMVLQFMSSLDSFLDTRGYWNEYGLACIRPLNQLMCFMTAEKRPFGFTTSASMPKKWATTPRPESSTSRA